MKICICVALILILILLIFIFDDKNESFNWDLKANGGESPDCYGETLRDCLKYNNCGICSKNNKKTCIPGNVDGPYFEERCSGWTYTDYDDLHIFGEKVLKNVDPWNRNLPGYEIIYPSPNGIYSL